jgi:acetate kinase
MRDGNQRAKLAFDIFIHRLDSCIGCMAVSAGGLDVLVFTAGIGENSAEVRSAACERLAFLGVSLDKDKNLSVKPDADLSPDRSRVRVLVI